MMAWSIPLNGKHLDKLFHYNSILSLNINNNISGDSPYSQKHLLQYASNNCKKKQDIK